MRRYAPVRTIDEKREGCFCGECSLKLGLHEGKSESEKSIGEIDARHRAWRREAQGAAVRFWRDARIFGLRIVGAGIFARRAEDRRARTRACGVRGTRGDRQMPGWYAGQAGRQRGL